MGDMLKLMQGGTDRTGFADMADQYAYTKPDRSAEERLALLKAAMEAGQGGQEGGEEEGGETGGFSLGGVFDDYIGNPLTSSIDEVDQTGKLAGSSVSQGFDNVIDNLKLFPTTAITSQIADLMMPYKEKEFDDLIEQGADPMGTALYLNKSGTIPGLDLEMGMADGGRVGMQQGGAPGGMAMPGLLGVASGSSGNLFSNYMPNPSAVPGPNYGTTAAPNYSTYQAPQLTSLASPYSGAQFGDIGDYLGGADPYAVGYNPYVDMGGSAYDQYGMGMTQEDIDKVFADTDKFSLAAQEAKRKAAEEAAKKKKPIGRGEGRQDEGDPPGGGGKSCFVEGTPVEMADGTTKEITNIKVGDETRGGIVEVTMQCLPARIYNYKDVLVSGSHWVIEDNQFVAVEDSKHGVLTDRIEPVYTLKTSKNRIWIYGIEFGDFETGSDADWEPHFEAVRQKLNKQLDEKTH